jgi:hypothetical protein
LLFGQFQESFPFQLTQVVVHLLPGEIQATGDLGGRLGLVEALQDAAAYGGQNRRDTADIVENLHLMGCGRRLHAGKSTLDK